MSYGTFYMYYLCADCAHRFKHPLDCMQSLGEQFGKCPKCGAQADFVKEGAIASDDADYEEID